MSTTVIVSPSNPVIECEAEQPQVHSFRKTIPQRQREYIKWGDKVRAYRPDQTRPRAPPCPEHRPASAAPRERAPPASSLSTPHTQNSREATAMPAPAVSHVELPKGIFRRSAPIAIPGAPADDLANHPQALWEVNYLGEYFPFVPDIIRSRRGIRENTIAPEGHIWQPILGCWVSEERPSSGTWGIRKPVTARESAQHDNNDDDEDCVIEEVDEIECTPALLDPAKELKRTGRWAVRVRDRRGNEIIIFRKEHKHDMYDAQKFIHP